MMKINKLLLLSAAIFFICSCTAKSNTSSSTNTVDPGTSQPGGSGEGGSGGSGGEGDSGGSSGGETDKTIAAHTLSDSNPPVIESNGEQITSSQWNAFKNASQSAFNKQYNYTYSYRYSSNITAIYTQKFTKNGWMIQNPNQSAVYYENINGKCYSYTKTGSNYIRSTSSENIQSRCSYAIYHEVETHMKEMSNYEFIEDDDLTDDFYLGYYHYAGIGFGYQIKFQNGYITWLHANIDGNDFEIKAVFETTINIPQSYSNN